MPPLVTVSMGLNIEAIAGQRYDRFTPAITIADIDAEGDVEAQIELALQTGRKVWDACADYIEEQCTKELGRDVNVGPGKAE